MAKRAFLMVAALLTSLCVATPAWAADGDLDTTFDSDGVVRTAFPGYAYGWATDVLVQQDGKIVAVGDQIWCDAGGGNCSFDFAVARYNTDGTLDPSFGTGGITSTPIGPTRDEATSVAIQSDGRIVVAGFSEVPDYEFALVRYNSDGTLDSSFSGDGKLTFMVGSGANLHSQASDVALQDDGKIVVAGYARLSGTIVSALARVNSDGTLDTSFSGDGKVESSNGPAHGLALQEDGNILLVSRAGTEFAVARYLTDGALDSSFGSGGVTTGQFAGGTSDPRSVAVQGDGRVVVGGFAHNGTNYDFGMARLDTDGSFDPTFSGDGLRSLAIGGFEDYPQAVGIQQDGKLVQVGYTYLADGSSDIALVRYNPDGSLDPTFSGDGVQTTSLSPTGYDQAMAFAIQSDGKLVVAGEDSSTEPRWMVARVIAKADFDPPDTTIDSGPSGTVNSASADFTFSSEPSATFACRIDSGSWSACNSGSKSYASLAEGSHTFEVRAIDLVGNVDASPATHTWTIDTVSPDTTIDSGPSGAVNSASADFAFSSEPSASFECRLDTGSFASCTSSKSYASLAEGSHTFDVRATDGAGNTDASPASRTWTVDTVSPGTTIDSGPSDPATTADATFTFSGGDPGGSGLAAFECQLDSVGWEVCTSPKSYTGLLNGPHAFEVRATDTAGNTDGIPDTWAWTVADPTGFMTDGLIKGSKDAAYLGDGTYNLTGAGQTKTLKAKKGKSVTFVVQLQNDGNGADSFTLAGTGKSKGFTVTYTAAGINVTAQVTAGTWTSASLAPDGTSDLQVKVKVGKKAKAKSKTLLMTATSVGNTSSQDAVKAAVKVKK